MEAETTDTIYIPTAGLYLEKTYQNPMTVAKGNLAGATIHIESADGYYSKDYVTTSIRLFVNDLLPGTYTITETVAPAGYIKSSQTYTVEIDANDCYTPMGSIPTYSFVNTAIVVRIIKEDMTTREALAGATIQIIPSNSSPYSITSTTEPYLLLNVSTGVTYTVKELVAPPGYLVPSDSFQFQIASSGTIQVLKISL